MVMWAVKGVAFEPSANANIFTLLHPHPHPSFFLTYVIPHKSEQHIGMSGKTPPHTITLGDVEAIADGPVAPDDAPDIDRNRLNAHFIARLGDGPGLNPVDYDAAHRQWR